MSQSHRLSPDIEQFLHTLEDGDQPDQEPGETIIDVYVGEDRVTFVRNQAETIDSTPPPPRDRSSFIGAWIFTIFFIALLAASLLAPKPDSSKAFSVTVQGYTLAPVRKSVTIQAKATGKGYIAPTTATGILTIYNGSILIQELPQRMILTNDNGVEIITNASVVVPAGNPPAFGMATVVAHAAVAGTNGNIAPFAINQTYGVSLYVRNLTAFTGGRDGQRFHFVAKSDVFNAVRPLLSTLDEQVPQLFSTIALSPDCVPTISATPPVGQRALTVQVTVKVSCSAISYKPQQVLQAIQSYSVRYGKGNVTNVAYQVIGENKQSVTFYVTAQWTPFVPRRMWAGK